MPKLRPLLKSPFFWIALLTTGYLLILAFRPSENWFGVPGQWTWGGRPPASSTYPRWGWAILCLAGIFCCGIAFDSTWERLGRWTRALLLLVLAIWIPTTQMNLTRIHDPDPLINYQYRIIGPHNGFWQTAVAIEDPLEYLRTYPDQMRTAGQNYIHLAVHPPGNILYLWGWKQIFTWLPGVGHFLAQAMRHYACTEFNFVTLQDAQIAAVFGQMLLIPISGLTLLPLYAWAKQVGGARSGWRAAVLFSLVPALGLFTMRWDSVYPFFTALTFAALHRGLTTRQPVWWYLAGLSVSLASFCSFGNATLAPAAAIYAAGYAGWQAGSIAETWRAVMVEWRGWLALIAGGLTLWVIYALVSGVTFFTVLSTSMSTHLYLGRTYWPWVVYNLYDLLTFVGVPTGCLFCLAVVQSWRQIRRRPRDILLLPALSLSVALLILDLSGIARGETGRMLMLWMPGLALVAALLLGQLKTRYGFALISGLLALQVLWMTLFLRVASTGMPAYVPHYPAADVATPSNTLDVTFAGAFHLRGYDIAPAQVTAGDVLSVTLYWQAAEKPDRPYTVFVHLSDAQGNLQAQHDSMPDENRLPTTCWFFGEAVSDLHTLALPETLPGGEYTLYIGWYYLPTLERLPITTAGAGQDRFQLPARIVIDTPDR